MTFEIPPSVRDYLSDKAFRGAVDSLVTNLDGKDMPDLDWVGARTYNRALLTAAQVRADYVDTMFALWDATFGAAGASALGSSYFDNKDPAAIWSECELSHWFYRTGRPDDCGQNDELYVELNAKDGVRLYLSRYVSDDEHDDIPSDFAVEGWHREPHDDAWDTATAHIQITELLKDPASTVDRLRSHAEAIVAYLGNG